ncbi:hypothetical protein [Roseimaritima ulvae]|uniref:Uncharacterized protein n=1 Tax=Roseimaritima ulvae TaxID=980254 RepID=A0A5B9QW59_9BACT|nr:hypothetical protein [Roseimaritima ulvae]QEG43247.1 hypothetical protein UC8_52940 [Roseimaritima ulvae]
MSKAYESLPSRGGWGLMLAVLVFLLCPNWQTSGTGQSPQAVEPVPAAVPGLPAGGLPMAGGSLIGGASSGDFLGFSRPAGDGGQIITLINTSHPWMAVYHVDGTGQIILKGSRQLNQDFEFQYNAVAPLPEEIRRITGS